MFLPPSVPFIARLAEFSYRGVEGHLLELARKLASEALFTGLQLTADLIRRYIRKALRTGIWRTLGPESRALLLALSRWRGTIRSQTLHKIVTQILLEIELSTTRGKAILYGIIIATSRVPHLLTNLLNNITKLLILGIQYTNLPPIYRIYG